MLSGSIYDVARQDKSSNFKVAAFWESQPGVNRYRADNNVK